MLAVDALQDKLWSFAFGEGPRKGVDQADRILAFDDAEEIEAEQEAEPFRKAEARLEDIGRVGGTSKGRGMIATGVEDVAGSIASCTKRVATQISSTYLNAPWKTAGNSETSQNHTRDRVTVRENASNILTEGGSWSAFTQMTLVSNGACCVLRSSNRCAWRLVDPFVADGGVVDRGVLEPREDLARDFAYPEFCARYPTRLTPCVGALTRSRWARAAAVRPRGAPGCDHVPHLRASLRARAASRARAFDL